MELRIESQSADPASLSDVSDGIPPQIRQLQAECVAELCQHPERFCQIELKVHHAFSSLADQLVAGLLAEAGKAAALEAAQKKSPMRRLLRFVLPGIAR